MCQNSAEENKRRYKSIKNKANKAVTKATREKAEEVHTESQNCPNGMSKLAKGLNTDAKEDEGGKCMRGSDGKLSFSEKKAVRSGRIIGKDHE